MFEYIFKKNQKSGTDFKENETLVLFQGHSKTTAEHFQDSHGY